MAFQSVRYLLGNTFLGCTLLAASPSLAETTVLVPITGGQFSASERDSDDGVGTVDSATLLTPYGTVNVTNFVVQGGRNITLDADPIRGIAQPGDIVEFKGLTTGTFIKNIGSDFSVDSAPTNFTGKFTSVQIFTDYAMGSGDITSGQIQLPKNDIGDVSNNSTNTPTYIPDTNNNSSNNTPTNIPDTNNNSNGENQDNGLKLDYNLSVNTPTDIPDANNNFNGENQDNGLNLKLDYNLSISPQIPTYRDTPVTSGDYYRDSLVASGDPNDPAIGDILNRKPTDVSSDREPSMLTKVGEGLAMWAKDVTKAVVDYSISGAKSAVEGLAGGVVDKFIFPTSGDVNAADKYIKTQEQALVSALVAHHENPTPASDQNIGKLIIPLAKEFGVSYTDGKLSSEGKLSSVVADIQTYRARDQNSVSTNVDSGIANSYYNLAIHYMGDKIPPNLQYLTTPPKGPKNTQNGSEDFCKASGCIKFTP